MGTRQTAYISDLARRVHAALEQDQLPVAEDLLVRLIAAAPDDPALLVPRDTALATVPAIADVHDVHDGKEDEPLTD